MDIEAIQTEGLELDQRQCLEALTVAVEALTAIERESMSVYIQNRASDALARITVIIETASNPVGLT